MSEPSGPRIRIGGKTFDSLDDLPPEARRKLEQALEQMRASGALEDRNRDGIPDRFETPLKVAGWIGRLTGNPQLRTRLEAQFRALTRAGQRAPGATGASPALPRANAPRPDMAPRAAAQRNAPPPSVRADDPRDESAAAEFIRKLAIVSVLVGLGYLAYRLLGG